MFVFIIVKAASVRCTVGEISDSLEQVFGRHQPTSRMVSGAYKSEYGDSIEVEETLKIVQVNPYNVILY